MKHFDLAHVFTKNIRIIFIHICKYSGGLEGSSLGGQVVSLLEIITCLGEFLVLFNYCDVLISCKANAELNQFGEPD